MFDGRPEGLYDSISTFGSFLKNIMEYLILNYDDGNLDSENSREIELPSYGIVGDVTNDIANSLIYSATVWIYQ